jgi:hypothetical protein
MVKRTKRRTQKKRRITRKKRGGQMPLSPTAFVGTPWGPNPSQWPEQHNGNWYTLNSYKTNPGYDSLSTNIKGGRRKKRKGGSSDINNLYQGLGYNLKSVFNTLTTATQPMNPAPYFQPNLEKITLKDIL